MEISTGADPYEQQLLAVFESCDRAGTGHLDSEGLDILCQKLQLQEGHDQLKDCLLRSGTGTKAVFTFSEFRDALLALLGAGRRQTEDIEDEREQSPDREVSPKFVFGQKKYGRRSRPESTDQESGGQDSIIDDADCDTFLPPISNDKDYKMKCSSILEEEHKLRRSTVSTPDSVASIIIDKDEMESSHGQGEAELRAAWKRLGVGSDGFLDKLELAMVCRAVGMEKVAEEVVNQVFSKLDVDSKGRISFEEFLQLFRSGTPQSPSHPIVSSPPPQPFQSSYLASLDINSTGYVSTDSIIELWEMAGVVGASGLLHDLGLAGSTEVNITLLASVLDEEIRNIRQDTKVHPNCSSHVALLTAALALAHVHIKCSKSSLEQMIGERDKLRNDLAEANERASLLAQEVDDRHARMEKASQMQIKVMEQRHSEQLKQLSLQLTGDREQLAASTQRLEKKLAQQQEEESRIRTDLTTLQMEYEALEKDNRSLADRLSECEELKARAEKEIQRMEKLQQRVSELEGSSDQVASLIESLTQLQAENATLRDRNDELTIQVETLTTRVSNRKQGSSISLEGCLGGGTKRRGNSPLALPPDENWDDDSPRMGKVRRCCTENDLSLDNVHMEGLAIRPLRHSESGLEADLETLDDSLTLSSSSVDKVNFKVGGDSDNGGLMAEVERLRSYVAELERSNEQYQMKLAVSDYQYSTSDDDDSVNTRSKVKSELKQVFSVIRKQVMDELSGQFDDVDSRAEDNTVFSNPQTEAVEMEIQTSLENPDDITKLKNECNDLKITLNKVHKELIKVMTNKKMCTHEDCILKHHLQNIILRIPHSGAVNGDVSDALVWESDINIVSNSQDSYEKTVLKNRNQIKISNGQENEMDSSLNVFVKQIGNMHFENLSQFAFELSGSLNNSDFVNEDISKSKPSAKCLDSEVENNIKNCDVNGKDILCNDGSDFSVNNAAQESDEKCLSNANKINSLLEENKKLHEKNAELENALEMMRIEYEKCEDYWQDKLNEERAIFEQEQRVSDEKFTDLQMKIQEYAEMFDNEDRRQDCRLPTIDERGSLEKQVTDLEEEFEEFRKAAESEAEERLKEVLRLRAELNSLECSSTSCHMVTEKQDIAIQVDQEMPTNQMPPAVPDTNINITTATVDVSPPESIECCCACHQSTVQAARRGIARLRENKHRLQSECDVLTQRRELMLRQLSELQHRTSLIYSTAQERRPSIDVQLFHNLSSRLRHQELRCRHLQSALKHQQRQTEKILQNAWEQHQTDLASVQNTLRITQEKLQQQTMASKKQMERLAVSDVLVKDLYVENTHLAATLQKLEQRCHFLTERATVASSV